MYSVKIVCYIMKCHNNIYQGHHLNIGNNNVSISMDIITIIPPQ